MAHSNLSAAVPELLWNPKKARLYFVVLLTRDKRSSWVLPLWSVLVGNSRLFVGIHSILKFVTAVLSSIVDGPRRSWMLGNSSL